MDAKDASSGVARNAVAEPTAAMCAQCQVSRQRDELMRMMFGFREAAGKRLAGLTERQYQIMQMVVAGQPSKNIAADLHISQRTVENHRASIMRRTGARSLPELARLSLAADWSIPPGWSTPPGAAGIGKEGQAGYALRRARPDMAGLRQGETHAVRQDRSQQRHLAGAAPSHHG
jgi:DNA-binding CsgD family transcriptional regulator